MGRRITLSNADIHKAFLQILKREELPEPTLEHRFAKPRRWAFDYAWPEHLVALEVEGGVWTRGRHTRGSGYIKDMEKYSEAAARGWRLVRVTPQQLPRAETLDLIRRCLTQQGAA